MGDTFKDRYNYDSLYKLALNIESVCDEFPVNAFLDATMDETWEQLTFKQRVMQISKNLGKYLPDYETAIDIIDKVILNYDVCLDGLALFFPGFVELYGQDKQNWDISIAALARYTQYASSEFAVRAFIIKDEERMMAKMYDWAKDDNEHIRRLASEGCRPKLPWGQALLSFQKNPSPILRILEQLKADSSLYVRKSVANNLNDISKNHPDVVIKIAEKWYGHDERTDWIIKHGCRTLLKKGCRDVLDIFGFADDEDLSVKNFQLLATSITIGENMTFGFEIAVKKAIKVRLEYGIDYVKANGKRNRKVFQISESDFKDNEKRQYTRTHSFADTSTRKHYSGIHSISLIVNGIEHGMLNFELMNDF